MKIGFYTFMLLISTGLTAYGQALDLKFLDRLASKASETANVSLDGSLLQMAAKFLSKDDPDEAKVKQLIVGLKGIYVKSFEFDADGAYSESDVTAVREHLRAPDWSRIVDVHSRKQGENTEIYIRTGGKGFGGLVIISTEPRQLTVVSIVGKIDLDQLSDLGGNLGVPKLELEKTKPTKKDD